ncbi:hypothetical protein P43SY_004738 [Pythium insidiosum]|uniref:RNA methyltransferase n=1 Tax=Pythium insidiosum TaxID=114742 RepID=A0AAD5LBM2_PYTIN|nr:hypothetical protein P43SY_004738 [Pythium insidiosum]
MEHEDGEMSASAETPLQAERVHVGDAHQKATASAKRRRESDEPAERATERDAAQTRRRNHRKVPKQHRVGNFRSYYNYRLGPHGHGEIVADDPRLAVLERDWFAGKRGLDVGCNSGDLTIAIAKTFAPAYLLGVDVDPELIARARGQLKDIMQRGQLEGALQVVAASTARSADAADAADMATEPSDAHPDAGDKDAGTAGAAAAELPLSFKLWKTPVHSKSSAPKVLGKVALGSEFPRNVVFKREDIVKDTHAGKDYDFITCVTKWIHLFHGDDGIKSVFQRLHDLLAPGGRLILEPQPWKSYHKRKFTSAVTAANYDKIQLRPKDFPTFLVETVGFKSCVFLQVCQTSSRGFRRPVYVVEKKSSSE